MTQACEALPLYWGLVPDDKQEDIVKAFRETLECGDAFVSGEVGLPYIIQTARKYGMNDIIAKFVEGMMEFTCNYQSVKGKIKVHVKDDENEILLETQVPQDVEKEIDISNLKIRGKHIKVV